MLRLFPILVLALGLPGVVAGSDPVADRKSGGMFQSGLPDRPGVYEQRLCQAVSIRWLQLLAQRESVQQHHRVAVTFTLHADGSVTNFSLEHGPNDAGLGLVCQKSITDSAPFGPWVSNLDAKSAGGRRLRLVFNFDAAGSPILGFTELDPDSRNTAKLREPAAWYLPREQRLASAAERPWIGQSPRLPASESSSDSGAGGWSIDPHPFHVSSLFWPPPDWPYDWGWFGPFPLGCMCP